VRKKPQRAKQRSNAAAELAKFIRESGLTFRAVAELLDATHPALLGWLSGKGRPLAYHRRAIHVWTKGRVNEHSWFTARELWLLGELERRTA
jgi:hypothetical protein